MKLSAKPSKASVKAEEYWKAVEQGDIKMVARLWREAEDDHHLEQVLLDVDESFQRACDRLAQERSPRDRSTR